MPQLPVTVHDIAEIVRAVGEILARRRQRERQVVLDVLDDVDAAVKLVADLDKLYTGLLARFASGPLVEDNAALAGLTDEARRFLMDRDLLDLFDPLLATIRADAHKPNADRNLAKLQEPLQRLSDALGLYRANLRQGGLGDLADGGALGPAATAPGPVGCT